MFEKCNGPSSPPYQSTEGGSNWWHRVHSRHPRMVSPQSSRRMAPPQSVNLPPSPETSLIGVIYRSGQSSTLFTLKFGIWLQSGFSADTKETHGTGAFVRLLKHMELRPNSINLMQYVGAAPTASSFWTQHLASRDSAKTASRWYENLLSVKIWCGLY